MTKKPRQGRHLGLARTNVGHYPWFDVLDDRAFDEPPEALVRLCKAGYLTFLAGYGGYGTI